MEEITVDLEEYDKQKLQEALSGGYVDIRVVVPTIDDMSNLNKTNPYSRIDIKETSSFEIALAINCLDEMRKTLIEKSPESEDMAKILSMFMSTKQFSINMKGEKDEQQ